jgi:hypothetical protein
MIIMCWGWGVLFVFLKLPTYLPGATHKTLQQSLPGSRQPLQLCPQLLKANQEDTTGFSSQELGQKMEALKFVILNN